MFKMCSQWQASRACRWPVPKLPAYSICVAGSSPLSISPSDFSCKPPGPAIGRLAIGVETGGESFGILVDSVAEVLSLADSDRESPPINLEQDLAGVSTGIFWLEHELLVVLDADRILDFRGRAAAA